MLYSMFPIDVRIQENPIENIKDGKSFLVNDMVRDGIEYFQQLYSDSPVQNPDQLIRRIIRTMSAEMIYEAVIQKSTDPTLYGRITNVAEQFINLREQILNTYMYESQKHNLQNTLDRIRSGLKESSIEGFYRELDNSSGLLQNQFMPFQIMLLRQFYQELVISGNATQLSLAVLDNVLTYASGNEPDISDLETDVSEITGFNTRKTLRNLRNILVWGMPGKGI